MTDPDDELWEQLAHRDWRRVKWRRTTGEESSEVCIAYGTPIHRKGSYYLRPAYTDGEVWLSQRGYEEMIQRTSGVRPSRRYGRPKRDRGSRGTG